jgi:dTDP-4-amino-4,6-dideoxygalactose transaminase
MLYRTGCIDFLSLDAGDSELEGRGLCIILNHGSIDCSKCSMSTTSYSRRDRQGVNSLAGKARVPLADPRGDLLELRERILGAVADVVDSGSYILGKEVLALEGELAARLGTLGAVGVGCGTEALALGLLAAGVRPGDEVVTVSHTSGATAAASFMIGATPVLVEVCEDTFCMDAGALEAAIGPRTKAIMPVHLYGHPADLGRICAISRRHGIPVIEDCAQAQGAMIDGHPVGTIGDIGCFSFYPTKTLGALGDGGMVTSRNGDLIERARLLRTYGWTKPQYSEISKGICSRLDELQAAILRIKLPRLAQYIEARRRIAQRYTEELASLPLALPSERPGCRHVYHLYVVRCDQRDNLADHLERDGVSTGVHYRYPVHVQPGFAAGVRISGSLRITEAVSREILSLPIYPSLPHHSQERVILSVRRFFGR